MSYHPLTKEICKLLNKKKFVYDTYEHEPVTTSEEAAKVRTGYKIEQGAKALILKLNKVTDESKYVMLVVPGNAKFDGKKIKKLLHTKDISFASEEEVMETTGGVKIGGVPPLGNLFNMRVVVDKKVFENDKIIFNAGDRSFSIAMYSKDYKKFVDPEIEEIT
jgi:Ala-tRNA(Pro) deacylase